MSLFIVFLIIVAILLWINIPGDDTPPVKILCDGGCGRETHSRPTRSNPHFVCNECLLTMDDPLQLRNIEVIE